MEGYPVTAEVISVCGLFFFDIDCLQVCVRQREPELHAYSLSLSLSHTHSRTFLVETLKT